MAAVATNGAEQEAARGRAPPPANARPAAILDPQLVMAARRGDSAQLKDLLRLKEEVATAESTLSRPSLSLLDGVTSNEGDSLLHVVAGCGDGDEFLRCAKIIYGNNKGLLVARNGRGDTPLHCAAGAGNGNMISHLVALVTSAEAAGDEMAVKEFVRTRNEHGETALHQAVRAASEAVIDKLMSVDPELACVPHEDGASPLYLAISLGDMDIARHLFDASKGRLSYSGPHGRNVLHAAVSRGQDALPMLLEWFTDDIQQGQWDGHSISRVNLLSQLTIQRDKHQNGSTPLHLAVSLNGRSWRGFAELLSRSFPNAWPLSEQRTRLLLDANASAAYQPDNEGSYPIHVAASVGSLEAVKALLERCPDCATLRDAKGRTFLHAAVDGESSTVVAYICRRTPQEFLPVLNLQDNNGDTALHRAVHVGNLPIFKSLIRNQHERLDVQNKEAQTPLDVSLSKVETYFYVSNPSYVILLSLAMLGAPPGGTRPDLFFEKQLPKEDKDKLSEKVISSAQVMSIVSVLVATVTFASALALPGGYRADGDAAGTPVLAGSYAFDAFILSDALAFFCSCLATFTLVFAGVPAIDSNIRSRYLRIAAILLRSSARSFSAAFALGLYLVLSPVAHKIAVTICVVGSASLLYGNIEVWQIIYTARLVHARYGIRLPTPRIYARAIFLHVMSHFWPLVIIFGLPAIRSWRR
ncbi:hypothetical protein ACP70R_042115 [Stipagrostis hirtigluma subsp. patula]